MSADTFSHRLTDDVYFTVADGIYSYVTRWGNVRDVAAFVGAIESKYFYRNYNLDREDVKAEAFSALYLAMVDYCGQRPVGSYASYHVFRAMRSYIRTVGELRYGQRFGQSKSSAMPSRIFELRYEPRIIPERALASSLEKIAARDELYDAEPPDTSDLWRRAEAIALATCGKNNERDWQWLKSRASLITLRELAAEGGVANSTVHMAVQRLCRRMAQMWPREELLIYQRICAKMYPGDIP